MKQRISLLLILVTLLAAVGCARNTPAPTVPVTFYYPAYETVYDGKTSVIHPEIRDGAGYEDDIAGLLNLYLKGPVSESLRSPFPKQVTVIRYGATSNIATLALSEAFAQLGGIDLTIACACIANTVFDLAQVDRVQILVADAQLNGQTSITFDRDDLYFSDISQPVGETEETTATSAQ